ncbi:hypothetical protein Taro_002262 [Colocasia esculenta]|uniref:BPL/LPL catalytic domain-containing protein n=1 Tax=Colocasia esculenta TaxID=4460 RepID=A0A843TIL9_COLES|nr:hypothetical protein [Colocasia esculenta]
MSGLALPCSRPAGSMLLDRQLGSNARASGMVLWASRNGPSAVETERRSRRRCDCFDLYRELVPYKEAWSWQKSLVERRHALMDRGEDDSDTLIILQHPPVYTLGTGSLEGNLKFDMKDAPYDVYRTERGGEVTYHGPGQIA